MILHFHLPFPSSISMHPPVQWPSRTRRHNGVTFFVHTVFEFVSSARYPHSRQRASRPAANKDRAADWSARANKRASVLDPAQLGARAWVQRRCARTSLGGVPHLPAPLVSPGALAHSSTAPAPPVAARLAPPSRSRLRWRDEPDLVDLRPQLARQIDRVPLVVHRNAVEAVGLFGPVIFGPEATEFVDLLDIAALEVDPKNPVLEPDVRQQVAFVHVNLVEVFYRLFSQVHAHSPHLLEALRIPKHEPCASIADDDLVGSGVIGRAPTLIGLRCILERLDELHVG
mmetsp:Transcript_46549/g.129759  ORF Transcript_46549/g.129759 Transcript_46549/m.129759 type:complete len:286 (-) Transcript_46549:332-1189(-)